MYEYKVSRRRFLRMAGKTLLGIMGVGMGLSSLVHAEYENPFQFRNPDIRLPNLRERQSTDSIVIHHLGNTDMDVPAEEIDRWHVDNGWLGIGYHFVIRKSGLIEYGRPLNSEGAHVYHDNYHTVGILVDGSFIHSYPTPSQYASLMYLVAGVLYNYGLPSKSGETVLGHCDFLNTSCPGSYLYASLPEVAQGAAEYLSMWGA